MTETQQDPTAADDELPSPPAMTSPGAEPSLADDLSYEEVQSAQDLGEAFPAGVYHFRANEHKVRLKKVDDWPSELLPDIQINWKCQQEPLVGRTFVDWIPFVSKNLVAQSRAGDQSAQGLLRSRLSRIKSIMKACSYDGKGGKVDPIAFLSLNPECKIQLNVRAGKTYDPDGELVPSGQMQNNAVKYIPLTTPTG